MKNSTTVDERWHLVIAGLIYPAVLGALLYTFMERLEALRWPPTFEQIGLALAALPFFALLIFDYAHTASSTVKGNYSVREFVADLVIVGIVFVSGRVMLGPAFNGFLVALLLTLARALGVYWEWVRGEKSGSAEADDTVAKNYKYDLVATGIYLVLAAAYWLGALASPLWLTLALLCDCATYVKYKAA